MDLSEKIKTSFIIILALLIIVSTGFVSSMYDEAIETNPGEVIDIPDFLQEELTEETEDDSETGDDDSEGDELDDLDEDGEGEGDIEETEGDPEETEGGGETTEGDRGGGDSRSYLKIILLILILLIIFSFVSYYYYKNYYNNTKEKSNNTKYELFIDNADNRVEEIYGEILKSNNIKPSKSSEEVRNILIEKGYNKKIINKIIDSFVKNKYSGEKLSEEEIKKVEKYYEQMKNG